jgi:large subunit ribosomal protein L24
MKLRKDDKVMVMIGRDKGKSGKVLAIMPATGQVVVEGVNLIKRHTKPSQKHPRGGILEIIKPIDASKVMALDPHSGKPARIGFEIKPDGSKERIFKVSPNHDRKEAKKATKPDAKAPTAETKPTTKPDAKTTKKSPQVAKSETKAGKK